MGTKTLGRPTKYSPEFAKLFCERLTTTQRGVDDICGDDDMPSKSSVWRWLSSNPDFWEMYTQARDFQTELMYDEISNIAYQPLTDNGKSVEDGGRLLDAGMAMAVMQQRKLIIDVLKFKLAKLQPKRFGDNRNVNVDVKVHRAVSPQEYERLLEEASKAPQIEDAEVEE